MYEVQLQYVIREGLSIQIGMPYNTTYILLSICGASKAVQRWVEIILPVMQSSALSYL